jgi:hypothetical protein
MANADRDVESSLQQPLNGHSQEEHDHDEHVHYSHRAPWWVLMLQAALTAISRDFSS